eukprot:6177063-Pleurochrysis_carterae.AAC.2
MFKELKYELANLHDAYDADEHEREIERMRDELMPDNFALRRRAARQTHRQVSTGRSGWRRRALLRELIDKKAFGNESRVIEETMRSVKMAHAPVPVSAANKFQGKKGKRAVAAAAFTRKGGSAGGAPPGRPPYEFPNG